MTREEKLKILSLSPILYNYLEENNKLENGLLVPAKLSLSDIPTSTKQNQYTEICKKEAGQSCIVGINLGNGIISNDNHNDFDGYKKFIIKDNVNRISSQTITIHKLFNHDNHAYRNIHEINLQNEILEVPIGVGAQGIGRLRDDKEFTEFRQNMFEGDILWYYYLSELKEIYFLVERGFNSLFNQNETLTISKRKEVQISSHTPEQIIYYGVPGTGKSYKIDNKKTIDFTDEQKMRVVFHPEYSNADFVGQILPTLNGGEVQYKFKAGPFSKILKRALKNPDKPYALIIEEINRGNAAAILGDIFQLLDRIQGDETKVENNTPYSKGWSIYSIENADLNAYIRSVSDDYTDKDIDSTKTVGNLKYTENTGIRLPPNLSIYATMNTSDQNVFTLDNAFQRRWDMVLVKNEFEKEEDIKNDTSLTNEEKTEKINSLKRQRDAIIENLEVIPWNKFQQIINTIIAQKSSDLGLSSLEDKRLGCWFVKAQDGKISKEIFAQKVLKYLYDDAFKFSRTEVFNAQYKSFEELSSAFIRGIGIDIFAENVKSGILNQVQNDKKEEIPEQVGNDRSEVQNDTNNT